MIKVLRGQNHRFQHCMTFPSILSWLAQVFAQNRSSVLIRKINLKMVMHVQISLRTSLLQFLVNNNAFLLCACTPIALGFSEVHFRNVSRICANSQFFLENRYVPVLAQPLYPEFQLSLEPTMLSFSFTHLLQEKSYPWRCSINTTSSMKPSLISPSGNDLSLL